MSDILSSTVDFKPNKTLKQFAKEVSSGTALDIGIGGGRDALYLASIGYEVTTYDVSPQFSEKCNQTAKESNLNVKSAYSTLNEIDVSSESFDLITSAWILHSLKKSESDLLLNKLLTGLKPAGIIILSLFSTEDPYFKSESETAEMVEENTFYSKERNSYMHYFSKDEILYHFKDLKLITLIEKLNLDTAHGSPHYHGIIEYVGTKDNPIKIYA